jgi:SSS family solute:Na+ symporter
VIVQRTFGARSLAQGQKGLLFAAAVKLLGPFYLVLPGIIAFHLFDGSLDDADNAYGALVQAVLPPWMLGFFAAVIFGAILSSFNSGLNSATTLFSVDLYKGVFREDASEAGMVRVGKIFGTAVAIGAIAMAPLIADFEGGLFDLMKRLSALYNVPLLTITLVGIFFPRMPPIAAKFALVIGPLFYGVFGLWQNNTLFGHQIHWLHLAGINIGLLTSVMLIVGTIWPRPKPYEQVYTDEVDITPWRGLWPSAIAVLVLIVALYA